MQIDRITYNDESNTELDEVLVKDVQTVHIERMDNGHIWIALNPKEGKRLVINLHTKRNAPILGNAELGL